MSANLPPKTPAIKDWLASAIASLKTAGIPSPKLDAEIILCHTLRCSRTHLLAHDDELLTLRQLEIADARLQLRLDRTPVAYIIGHKEFYGRSFTVSPATLIPRPESEMIITLLKELFMQTTLPVHDSVTRLIDVGTGSGCLGITAKLEIPELDVTLADISRHALTVAEKNTKICKVDVSIIRSDLLMSYPFRPNYIIANLPYVDPEWECSPETAHEPELALFASDNGLSLIYKLIEQASTQLQPSGTLLLEADPRQHKAIVSYAKNRDFRLAEIRDFIVCLRKD